MELTLTHLENCFNAAKEKKAKFVGVKISMEGFPTPEIIINEISNYDKKLEYYKHAYKDNLVLKAYDGIKIVGFTYGDTFESIQNDLIGAPTLPEMCRPVAKFLEEKYDLHTEVVISMDNVKVVTAQLGFPIN